jgi:HAMP domain-containing protein
MFGLELVLNLCWLLLIGPGVYLWLRHRRQAKPLLQHSIALACLLVLLFPVISATDDLHAVRQEIEEPGSNKPTKQVVKRAAAPDVTASAASPVSVLQFLPDDGICARVETFSIKVDVYADLASASTRAPPSSFLS